MIDQWTQLDRHLEKQPDLLCVGFHQAGSTTQCAQGATTSSCLPSWMPKPLGSMRICPPLSRSAWPPPAASCWRCPPGRSLMTARPPTRLQRRSLTLRRTCCMVCCTRMASATCCASTAWRAALLHSQACSSSVHVINASQQHNSFSTIMTTWSSCLLVRRSDVRVRDLSTTHRADRRADHDIVGPPVRVAESEGGQR